MSGVGHGSQAAAYDCTLPIALKHAEGTTVSIGTVKTPTVSNSDLPGLLGLQALRRNRAIIDFSSLKIYFAGPGEYNLDKAMPPGTDVFQTELAPSGHMVIPCCEYTPGLPQQVEGSLSLLSKHQTGQEPEEKPGTSSSPGPNNCYQ